MSIYKRLKVVKLKNWNSPDDVPLEAEAKILKSLDGVNTSTESHGHNVRTHPAIAIYYESFNVTLNATKYLCIVSEYCSVRVFNHSKKMGFTCTHLLFT
jgi:hypothetical protein